VILPSWQITEVVGSVWLQQVCVPNSQEYHPEQGAPVGTGNWVGHTVITAPDPPLSAPPASPVALNDELSEQPTATIAIAAPRTRQALTLDMSPKAATHVPRHGR
jgi:hypothetical protein